MYFSQITTSEKRVTSELEEGEETVTDGETELTCSYHCGTATPKPVSNMPIHTLLQEQAVRVKTPTVALVYGKIHLLIFCMLSSWSQDYVRWLMSAQLSYALVSTYYS